MLLSSGLCPTALDPTQTRTYAQVRVWSVGVVPSKFPGGTYHTDGSGGSEGSDAHLRRCGLGVARLDGFLFQWGLFAPLPGVRQTVPRAELHAILLVATLTQDTPEAVTVATDALGVYQTYGKPSS